MVVELEASQKKQDSGTEEPVVCNGLTSTNSDSQDGAGSSHEEDEAEEPEENDPHKSHSVVLQKELDFIKNKNSQLIEENNKLVCKVQSLEEGRVVLEQKLLRLQESNSENLHQIASLQSDLAATESFKVQLQK